MTALPKAHPPTTEENKGGYPGRLQPILRRAGAGLDEVVVRNFGDPGEFTSIGLSRINFVLNSVDKDDVVAVIIMEGTNDVNKIINGITSIQTTVSNLEQMAQRVKARGHFPLYSTIIPRNNRADKDRRNIVTFALVIALRDQTSTGNRVTAEPWEVFFWTPNRNNTIYFQGSDPIGHPNAAGFDLLAELFADKLLEIDSLGPVFSGLEKTGSSTEIKKNDVLDALVHESGAGINRPETYLTLNNRRIESEQTGNKRRLELSHTVTKKELGCTGRIGIHTEDLAEPPNDRDLFLIEYNIPGSKSPVGDIDGDCRVDGADLLIFAQGFGAISGDERYDPLLDFNNDGKIGGKDFAKLAKNFGVDKS